MTSFSRNSIEERKEREDRLQLRYGHFIMVRNEGQALLKLSGSVSMTFLNVVVDARSVGRRTGGDE